jgi:tRNA pseudouridine38-40 synthase
VDNPINLTRYFIKLSYNGTRFHGWQRQPNGITVQQILEEAMSLILRSNTKLTGAGRTDTGVHAADYYAHFDMPHQLSDSERETLVYRLNAYLEHDIAIRSILPVNSMAHARFSATSRTYKYFVTRVKNPFNHPFSLFVYGNLDWIMMNEGASLLMNYSDFTSFSKVDTDTKTNICKITHARWEVMEDDLVFTITANRFLRNMVRAITGTLLDLGKGKLTVDELRRIIESLNRSEASDSAPAKGLVLHSIEYPDEVFL